LRHGVEFAVREQPQYNSDCNAANLLVFHLQILLSYFGGGLNGWSVYNDLQKTVQSINQSINKQSINCWCMDAYITIFYDCYSLISPTTPIWLWQVTTVPNRNDTYGPRLRPTFMGKRLYWAWRNYSSRRKAFSRIPLTGASAAVRAGLKMTHRMTSDWSRLETECSLSQVVHRLISSLVHHSPIGSVGSEYTINQSS